jgi:hypothetical protein
MGAALLIDSAKEGSQGPKDICWGGYTFLYLIKIFLMLPKIIHPTHNIRAGMFFNITMIGTSATEYLFIRTCILFLHNIAPISILYSTQLLLVQFFHLPIYLEHIPYPIQMWLTAEAIFLITIIIPLKYSLHRYTICHRPLSAECREKLFRSCIASVPNLEKYLSQWLMVSEGECIKRDNVKDFVRWAFFRPDYEHERDQQDEVEIEAYTTEIEKLIGQKLAPGRIDLKGLGQLLHETTGSHRSLLWYTVS